jgi:hypothetical protein
MEALAKKTILRIELWNAVLLLALLLTIGRSKWVDANALVIGGIFMGFNFFLLSYGVAWILGPLSGKGRIKAGIALLVLKIILFLGLLTTLFFRFNLDAISFALGFSTLILAILLESVLRTVNKLET